ncbi:hypothetical protein ACHAQA_002829 [Verticillium albo-atrum]
MRAHSWLWALLWLCLSPAVNAQEGEPLCDIGRALESQRRSVKGLYARDQSQTAAFSGLSNGYDEDDDHRSGWVETRNQGVYVRQAGGKKLPLDKGPDRTTGTVRSYIEKKFDNAKGEIGIVPQPAQPEKWILGGESEMKISVTATAEWVKFLKSKKEWTMSGLEGCTAIFIITEHGFWAAHLWEGDKQRKYGASGGAAFNGWYGDDYKKRPIDDFERVAVRIMDEITPAEGINYVSLQDLKAQSKPALKNKAFTGALPGSKMEVLIFTKEADKKDQGIFEYPAQVELITRKLIEYLPGLTEPQIKTRPYKHVPKDQRNHKVDGTVILEYTPYERDNTSGSNNGCSKVARVRVWARTDEFSGTARRGSGGEPVIDYDWVHPG